MNEFSELKRILLSVWVDCNDITEKDAKFLDHFVEGDETYLDAILRKLNIPFDWRQWLDDNAWDKSRTGRHDRDYKNLGHEIYRRVKQS